VTIPESEKLLPEPLVTELVAGLDGWLREGPEISRTYTFDGFGPAMAFANNVAGAANAANHHPDIHVERYKTVRLVLTTHATGGISQADIDLAMQIDKIPR